MLGGVENSRTEYFWGSLIAFSSATSVKRVEPFILSICLTCSRVKEFEEKGLSCLEVSAKNRDETQGFKGSGA